MKKGKGRGRKKKRGKHAAVSPLPGAPECAAVRDLALFSLLAFKGKFVTEPGFCTSVIFFSPFSLVARCSFYFFFKLHPLLKARIQIAIYNLFTGPSPLSSIRSLHLAAGSSPLPAALPLMLFILFFYSFFFFFTPPPPPSREQPWFSLRLGSFSGIGRSPALLPPRNVIPSV